MQAYWQAVQRLTNKKGVTIMSRSRGFCKDKKLEQLQDDIRTAIVIGETQHHIPRSRTIEASGVSVATFYKCWKEPEQFRVGQLHRIYETLRIPEEARRYG